MFQKNHSTMMASGLAIGLALVGLGMGCKGQDRRMFPSAAEQSAKMDAAKNRQRGHWQQMADNAILSDMAVYDSNFIPNSSELSGTGAERLSRMAAYLDTYGGVVRYDTLIDNEELVQARLDNVREYIEVTGADLSRVEVKASLASGRSLSAGEAIRVSAKGTAGPQTGGGSPMILGPAPNP